MSKRSKLSDELRKAVDEAPMSRYALAQLSGVSAAVLCRFVAGERGMSLESIDALAAVLDLHIATGRRAAKSARTPAKKQRNAKR